VTVIKMDEVWLRGLALCMQKLSELVPSSCNHVSLRRIEVKKWYNAGMHYVNA